VSALTQRPWRALCRRHEDANGFHLPEPFAAGHAVVSGRAGGAVALTLENLG
jgi:hypothetical protein